MAGSCSIFLTSRFLAPETKGLSVAFRGLHAMQEGSDDALVSPASCVSIFMATLVAYPAAWPNAHPRFFDEDTSLYRASN
jgi:hypothetical protein